VVLISILARVIMSRASDHDGYFSLSLWIEDLHLCIHASNSNGSPSLVCGASPQDVSKGSLDLRLRRTLVASNYIYAHFKHMLIDV
jgi:hypothetical protein